ncbi:MAG: UbiX family flavin prenyltransferase [Salibacteraceae bacterium]
MTKKHKLVVGVTGASGSIYAKVLLEKLHAMQDQLEAVGMVMSNNAKDVWEYELGNRNFEDLTFPIYDRKDFMAPFASGSAKYETLIVVPCSMGTMGRIANGISDDLITRAADVMLKERRNLILVVRDTPINLILINNMKTITEAGGIICPASPSFYSRPQTFDELAATVVDRVLDLAGLNHKSYRWSEAE